MFLNVKIRFNFFSLRSSKIARVVVKTTVMFLMEHMKEKKVFLILVIELFAYRKAIHTG
jgi:hypothetical protein